MLHSCGSTELRFSTKDYIYTPSNCKLQTLQTPFNSKLFLGFNSRTQIPSGNNLYKNSKIPQTQTKNSRKIGSLPEFNLHVNSKIAAFPKKNINRGKKNKYGGILPSILRSLEIDSDIEKTLNSYPTKLNSKEQTVILKEQRKWDRAFRIFEWFKSQEDYTPNVIHYNVVLRALGRAQKWDELRLCWIEMAKNGIFPTNNTYSMLVDVYGKSGLVKESLLWIKHMKSRGIFPDEVTMATAVKVLKDAGEYDRADKFYKNWCSGKIELDDLDFDEIGESQPVSFKEFLSTELFRTGGRVQSLPSQDARKPRLTATYNTLIDLYGKAGRLNDAANVFSDMLKSGVALDAFTFNTMIFICGTQGYMSEAEALLAKMEEHGVSPDTKTYNVFLSLHANLGNIDKVLECYNKIRDVGLFPDDVTHRAVLRVLCEKKMVEEVEKLIEGIEKLGMKIDEKSLPVLTKMYVDQGLIDRAKILIEKSRLSGEFSSRTYVALIDVYAEKGIWEEAEALFTRGGLVKKDVSEYNVMIKAYGKAKLYDKSVSLFNGMRNQGVWPDECTFNSLIQMLAGGEFLDKAQQMLDEMNLTGLKPSCLTYSSVISTFARKKMLTEAVDLFQEMLAKGVKPNEIVYGSLIDAFAESGEFEEAIQYFHDMESSGIPVNQIVLTSVIKAHGKIGSVEGAKQVYEKMKGMDMGPDIVASNSMLNLYGDLGMVYEAEAIYDHLREKNLADGVSYATMMYVYKNMGMLDDAIKIAEAMRNSDLVKDSVSFNKVMSCYSTHGDLIQCGELLHDMVVKRKISPDSGTFKVLFTILKKGGISIEAIRQLDFSYREGKPFAKQAIITSVFSVAGLHEYALESCGIFTKEDVGPDSFAYNAAIRAYAAYGKVDDALRMFMRMQDEGLEPDVVTLISLVGCYGKAGVLEGVKRVHSRLKYGGIESSESLYKAVADAYEKCNRRDLAELVKQEMRFEDFEGEEGKGEESENVDEDLEFSS